MSDLQLVPIGEKLQKGDLVSFGTSTKICPVDEEAYGTVVLNHDYAKFWRPSEQTDMFHYAKVKQVAELYRLVGNKLEPTGEVVEICNTERGATVLCKEGNWHIITTDC